MTHFVISVGLEHDQILQDLEPTVHGRGRNPESMDDLFFGVHDEMLYARKSEPISGILVFLSLLSFTH